MNIAFVVSSLANKGPVVLVKDLARNLKDRVGEIIVFYFDNIKDLDFECDTKQISFFDTINFDRFDIVHSHGIRPDAFLLKNRNRIKGKTFSTLHNYMDEELKYTYNNFISFFVPRLWIFLLKSHDRIITLSNHMSNYYVAKGIDKSKIVYIYNGRDISSGNNPVPPEDLDRIQSLSENHKIIGIIGFLTRRKGVHQIIQLLSINPNMALLVIGDGPEKKNLEELSIRLGVRDRICFLGYRREPERYLPHIHVYAMSSYSEGFPLVLIEAGLKKRKVICSDIALFRELFTEDEVSFFMLDDIKSLQKAVDYALHKSSLELNLYNVIQRKYSLSNMVDGYLAAYNRSLKEVNGH